MPPQSFLVVVTLLLTAFPVQGAGSDQRTALAIERPAAGLSLIGRDATLQLVVSGQSSTGVVRDLTRAVRYSAAPAGIVRVEDTGLVHALTDGKAMVRAEGPDGSSVTATLTVSHVQTDRPIHFGNEVVPVFTKYGCNAGGCHGKADGQNGFKLSLLGFEPQEDYEYIVREARGRRIFPAAPRHSLLLLKASGQLAHGGGKKLAPDSPFYNLLARWIAQGAPFGQADDPTVTGIEVSPRERLLAAEGTQQLAVRAHLSDGSVRDVTRMTQFESNEPDLAEVSQTGLVRARRVPGCAAVMARFQSHVAVFSATVPLGQPVTDLPPERNFIDTLVFAQWKKLGLPPSKLADEGTFLRRATLDLTGRLPTLEEAKAFLADQAPDRNDKLIDRLLASRAHADFFANKWSALLRNRRASEKVDPKPTVAFHAWIRDSLHANKPYDRLVREVLTAVGEEAKDPPVVWYREVREPSAQVEDVAQLFLGQRIECARCHHHPFEKWSQQDYPGLAAFFSRLEIKDPPPPKKKRKKGEPPPRDPPLTVAHKPGPARSIHPRTGAAIAPTPLGGRPLSLDGKQDPRAALAAWLTAPENPYFARALANRYWKHFFGRGLVDPEDDLRSTNPPVNPALLSALEREFIDSGYDLKKLIRAICTSSTYRLSAAPNAHNAGDTQSFSRFRPRRLHAEVLLDAIDDLTLAKTRFKGVPAGTRAVQLPDNQFPSYFLSVFGRPQSATACECERSADATLAQTLHLLNSPEVLAKADGPRAVELARDKRAEEEKLRDLYWIAYTREPGPEERKELLGHIERKGKDAYADVLWALVNTKEFQFNK